MKVTGDKKTNVEFLDGSIAKLPEIKEKQTINFIWQSYINKKIQCYLIKNFMKGIKY